MTDLLHDWSGLSEGIMIRIGKFLIPKEKLGARLVCTDWAKHMSKNITTLKVSGTGPRTLGKEFVPDVKSILWTLPPNGDGFVNAPWGNIELLSLYSTLYFGYVELEVPQPTNYGAEIAKIVFECGSPTKLKYLHFGSFSKYIYELPRGISNLKNIVKLNISNCGFSDEIACELASLQKCEGIDLSSNPITDDGCKHIRNMVSLKTFVVTDSSVTDSILKYLPSSVTSIDVSNSFLRFDLDVNLPNIIEIKASELRQELGGKSFEGMQNVRSLSLHDTTVCRESINRICENMNKLEEIDIQGHWSTQIYMFMKGISENYENEVYPIPSSTRILTMCGYLPIFNTNLMNLTSISLKCITGHAPNQMWIIGNTLPKLRVLELKFWNYEFDIIAALKISQLHTIMFAHCQGISDSVLNIITVPKNIQKLVIHMCNRVSEAGLAHVSHVRSVIHRR